MLKITIPEQELWDESKQEFCYIKSITLQLEHSLVSLHKWESKWHVPFFGKEEKSAEQIIDYVRCMTLTQNVNPEVYRGLTKENIDQIMEYINDPMTATWFSNDGKKPPNREIYTAEIFYYSMVALSIPFECQKWHLNQLITLIRVCQEKNTPPKKKSRREIAQHHAAINAARRAKAKKR